MKIQFFKNKNKQWYFRIVARNGKIVAQSEGYKTKQGCLKTIDLLRAGFMQFVLVEIIYLENLKK